MPDPAPLLVRVGGLTRSDLVAALGAAGVRLNESAMTLLDDVVFDAAETDDVQIVEHRVGDLGLDDGATLAQIVAAAYERGLHCCPPITGPYLRLSVLDQQAAPDSIMRNGRAPTGSVTVASAPLRHDDDYPKGFYLRVVDGVPWLRGYRCTATYGWSTQDRFAFRVRSPAE